MNHAKAAAGCQWKRAAMLSACASTVTGAVFIWSLPPPALVDASKISMQAAANVR